MTFEYIGKRMIPKVLKDGVVHDQPFSNASIFTNIRHWMIKKIAMGDVVIINADVSVIRNYLYHHPIDLKNIDGCLMEHNNINMLPDMQIILTQYKSSNYCN